MRDGLATPDAGLLARKGSARPAMRPQGGGIDDLGWNDMTGGAPAPAKRRPITFPAAPEPGKPEVVRQQEAIAREFAPVPPAAVRQPAAPAPATRIKAFTLRLDPERHLRLRTACAQEGRSGQRLVIDALDRLLADLVPEGNRP